MKPNRVRSGTLSFSGFSCRAVSVQLGPDVCHCYPMLTDAFRALFPQLEAVLTAVCRGQEFSWLAYCGPAGDPPYPRRLRNP
jgi:hypothetical protein